MDPRRILRTAALMLIGDPMPMTKPYQLYACHKEVHAFQIKQVRYISERNVYEITSTDPEHATVTVPAMWQDHHGAKPGGYFVMYKDDYQSFSPAKAFEDGYTAVP